MEFRILGPLEVVDQGRPLPLGGAKQRALLAVLVLNPNRVISADRLIDALWGEQVPDGAGHTLHVYVSKLRKALGGAAGASVPVLATEASGYVLRVDDEQIDLHRFERVVSEGRRALADGTWERAATLLKQGLDLWRGPPFAEFADQAFARPEIARIEDLRLSAIEDRFEADLALGRHGELVGELRSLVTEYPLRERLRGQLMVALYRSGRQVEALQVYRDGRQMLSDELGIDPGPELQRLERAILQQDPELELMPLEKAPAAEPVRAPPLLASRTRRAAVTSGIVVLTAVVVLVAVLVTLGRPPKSPASVPADSVGRIDADTGEIVAAIPTAGDEPTALTWFADSLWVANTASRTVARIDAADGRVVRTIPTDGVPTAIAAGLGRVWVLNGFEGTVLALDPRTNDVAATIEVPAGSGGIALGAGAVWVTNTLDATVTRIGPQTGEVVATISLGGADGARPEAIAARSDAVWVADGLTPTLWRIDPTSDRVVASPGLRGVPTAIAVGADGTAWVTAYSADLVSAVDPATLQARTIRVGEGPTGIAVTNAAVWVANSAARTLSEIDPVRGRVVRTIRIGGTPEGVAVGGDSVWVSVHT